MNPSPEDVFKRLHRLARYAVIVAYALCVALFLWDMWETITRVHLAQEIATRINENRPTSLEDLCVALGPHYEQHRIFHEECDEKVLTGASIRIQPRKWLHIWVDLEGDKQTVKKMALIYAASEPISLENPRQDLPTFHVSNIVLALFCAAFLAMWAWATKAYPLNLFKGIYAFFMALPLILLLPLALITGMRIMF